MALDAKPTLPYSVQLNSDRDLIKSGTCYFKKPNI